MSSSADPPDRPLPPASPVLAVLDADGHPRRADPHAPQIRADDLGVLRGESVFETTRTFGGSAFRLTEHLDRMENSAARVQLTLPPRAALMALAACALETFGRGDGSLRLVVTKGPDGLGGVSFALATTVGAMSLSARNDGVRAVTLTLGVPAVLRCDASWLLGGVKSTSYAPAMAALRSATEMHAGDAIYVSSDGEVLEAPTANVVAVLDGAVLTPPEDEVGILPGTTVGFFGDTITRRRLTVDQLRASSEVLLLSSVRGVVPVLELDGRPIGTGGVGPRGAAMREEYEAAVRSLGN